MTEPRDWAALERMPEFRELVRAKRAFILPACLFFVVYYFALPVLVGYWPEAMSRPVAGKINVAYLFALSQFAMAWVIMALYVRRARRYDAMAQQLIRRVTHSASEHGERASGAERATKPRASDAVGESEGRSPSDQTR